jgi:hypothetical protein
MASRVYIWIRSSVSLQICQTKHQSSLFCDYNISFSCLSHSFPTFVFFFASIHTMHFSIIPICLALFGVATAQNQFSSPKGGVENEFSQTWFEGDTMNIEWYGEWKGTGAGADVVDLWVTWFHSPAFSQLILRMFP